MAIGVTVPISRVWKLRPGEFGDLSKVIQAATGQSEDIITLHLGYYHIKSLTEVFKVYVCVRVYNFFRYNYGLVLYLLIVTGQFLLNSVIFFIFLCQSYM